MMCPVCYSTADPALVLKDIAICAVCGMALVPTTDGFGWRMAKHADIDGLTDDEMRQLREIGTPLMQARSAQRVKR